MEPHIRVSNKIPSSHAQYQVSHAGAEFVTGDFGSFLTQEITTPFWRLGWLNFFIKEDSYLYPTTQTAMVALYATIDGDIPCKLEGFGDLVLQNRRYGFYYIPPEVKNEAFFQAGDYDAVYVSFSLTFLSQFIDENPRFKDLYTRQNEQVNSGIALPTYPITQVELDILNKIRYSRYKGKSQELFIQARINDLLVSYFQALEGAGKEEVDTNELEQRIQDVANYITHHLHQSLSIADLSKKARLNLDKFEKTFKQVMGSAPQKFIEDTRMQEAARLLRTTDIPIADVAYKVGYADQGYFTKVFKRVFGVTPRKYRQDNSDANNSV
ncbi:helix-turn-helix transcriptional regulator [Chitinophaga pinensis]|nr:AraC family transcriptional regulator [Chitinophaga pinensis]